MLKSSSGVHEVDETTRAGLSFRKARKRVGGEARAPETSNSKARASGVECGEAMWVKGVE